MKKAETVMSMTGIISDSKFVKSYHCPGCGNEVKVYQVKINIGPQKGKYVESKRGCKCDDIALAKKILDENEQRRRAKFKKIFDTNSLINNSLQQATFENYQPTNDGLKEAKEKAEKYAESFSPDNPQNLLMSGPYGTGKSHLAVSIMKILIEKEYTCIFISVPKLLTKIRSTYSKDSQHTENDLLNMLESVDCLVLDDIGAENNASDWAVSKVFEVVDSRIGKHTIYTTNLTGLELQTKVGRRNFSRMMQDTEVLKMDGMDYRLRGFM